MTGLAAIRLRFVRARALARPSCGPFIAVRVPTVRGFDDGAARGARAVHPERRVNHPRVRRRGAVQPSAPTIGAAFEPCELDSRQTTAGSSRRMVPAAASISAGKPTGTVNWRSMWPIIEPRNAGTPSGLTWSANTSSSVSAP